MLWLDLPIGKTD